MSAFLPGRLDVAVLVTLAAALVGGLGNVLFSAHDGSPLALASSRFLFGLLFALAWIRLTRRPPSSSPFRSGSRAARMRLLAAVSGAASPVLLMLASEQVGTALFTLAAGTAPLFTFLLAPLFSFPPVGPRRTLLAAAAFLFSALALLADASAPALSPPLGLALAAGSAFSLALSLLAAAHAGPLRPARLLADLCLAGLLLSLPLSLLLPFSLSPSTLAVALLIALLPGGLAKAALYWSLQRTAPQLVAASLTVSVFSAAVGGWLLLGERISVLSALFGLLSLLLLALLALRPASVR